MLPLLYSLYYLHCVRPVVTKSVCDRTCDAFCQNNYYYPPYQRNIAFGLSVCLSISTIILNWCSQTVCAYFRAPLWCQSTSDHMYPLLSSRLIPRSRGRSWLSRSRSSLICWRAAIVVYYTLLKTNFTACWLQKVCKIDLMINVTSGREHAVATVVLSSLSYPRFHSHLLSKYENRILIEIIIVRINFGF